MNRMRSWGRLFLALASGLCAAGCHHRRVPPAAGSNPWPIRFEDRASEAGIHFTLGHHGHSPLSILETAPGGCAFADLDGDGKDDVILVGPPNCAVYRNLGDGHFQDVTQQMGLTRTSSWMGCALGDVDNDGFPDLLVTGYRCTRFYGNEGGHRFVDRTRESGLESTLWTTSAAFADIDGDGWLDLYVGAYVQYHRGERDLCRVGNVPSACGPEIYSPEKGRLYHNRGNGTFADITNTSGLAQAAGKTWGVSFADYDDDGRPDLYLANDQMQGNLFHNRGRNRFEEVGTLAGTAYDDRGGVQGGMGVDWGDVDDDGRLDLLVTTFVGQAKQIYRNEGHGLFSPVSRENGVALPTYPFVAFGCGFLDADNNGTLDLLVANGHIRDNAHAINSGESYPQPLQLLANSPPGQFRDVSAQAGPPFATRLVGRGLAFSDYDGNGAPDALVVDLEGPARLLRNPGGAPGHWVGLRLKNGTRNRDAIGARVELWAGGKLQVREVNAGRSVLSSSSTAIHFGLGTNSRVDRLVTRWPGGRREEWQSLPTDRYITLRRGSGAGIR